MNNPLRRIRRFWYFASRALGLKAPYLGRKYAVRRPYFETRAAFDNTPRPITKRFVALDWKVSPDTEND